MRWLWVQVVTGFLISWRLVELWRFYSLLLWWQWWISSCDKLSWLIQNHWKLITILLLIVITTLSLSSLPKLPDVLETDKTHHLIAYFFLALPSAVAKPKNYLFLGLCFIAYGGLIEILQPYVNSHGEWLDFLGNMTGVILAYIVLSIYRFFK